MAGNKSDDGSLAAVGLGTKREAINCDEFEEEDLRGKKRQRIDLSNSETAVIMQDEMTARPTAEIEQKVESLSSTGEVGDCLLSECD